MKKQTVEQIYQEQQMKQNHPISKERAQQAIATPEQKEAQKILNTLKQALLQSQQAVRQAQMSYPVNAELSQADQKLTEATQQIKQLETIKLSISNGTEQQLKQLDYQIEAASGTLQMIQQAIGQNG